MVPLDSECLKPFPLDLPLDIARLIFEQAIEEHPTPVHLALVSRQVQHWVEPWIYRHLSFRSDAQFELFYRTFRDRQFSLTKPPEFYSRHVNTLYVGCNSPRTERLCELGEVLTGLHALAAWDGTWGCTTLYFMKKVDEAASFPSNVDLAGWNRDVWKDYPYRHLRKLSLSSRSLHLQDLTFAHRMFCNLTYLDVYFTYPFEWPSLVFLHNLTHLSVDMATLAYPKLSMFEITMWIQTITSFCDHLSMMKVISFACVDGDSVDFDVLDEEGNYFLPPDLDILNERTGSDPGPLCSLDIDEENLHPWTRMAIGLYHPLVVIGTLTEDLPENHLLKEYLVLFEWPKNVWDWDFSIPVREHKESWEIAEEIIERRRKEKEEGISGFRDIVIRRWKTSNAASFNNSKSC